MAFLAALIAGFFFPAIHLSAQAFDPTLIEGAEKTDREKREDAEAEAKRKAENEARRKKMMDDYWIRLNPGVLISNTSIRIIGQGARSGSTATMVSKSGFGKPDWMLDLKTKDYPLSEHWGIHLLAHTRSFDLNNQRYEQTISADDGSSSSETVQEDLGTRMRGYYALTVPVLYYNFNGREEGFRLGFGYGPSVVRIQGTASLDSGITNAPLFLSQDRDTLVRNLQLNTIVQGAVDFTRGDPVYGSL
ncbi:MAG: hypothetical protein KDK23_17360, partial [Leptospiraceae bacterium]|nr:hypothetical protein [Leptospiraceae bacterium]